MRKIVLALCLLLSAIAVKAQPTKIYLTESPASADVTYAFTKTSINADVKVWIGQSVYSDIDVCFVNRPWSNSIDVELVSSQTLADVSICLSGSPAFADKTICITDVFAYADICISLWNYPSTFTKEIYVKGVDPNKLSKEAKVAILHVLGLLNKKRSTF